MAKTSIEVSMNSQKLLTIRTERGGGKRSQGKEGKRLSKVKSRCQLKSKVSRRGQGLVGTIKKAKEIPVIKETK